jgi:hypothetical protein
VVRGDGIDEVLDVAVAVVDLMATYGTHFLAITLNDDFIGNKIRPQRISFRHRRRGNHVSRRMGH